MGRRIPTNGTITTAKKKGTNTYIGDNETFLDRNAKLIPSDETTTALTNMNWIAGHHTVDSLENLYNIPDFILSQETYADQISTTGADAKGQLWYVENESCHYMLIDWSNRRNANGWSKTNLKSATDSSGASSTQYANKDYTYTNISSITIEGDGTLTYTGWTPGYRISTYENSDIQRVELSYTALTSTGKTTIKTIEFPMLNEGVTIERGDSSDDGSEICTVGGTMTSAQYNSLLNRIKAIEDGSDSSSKEYNEQYNELKQKYETIEKNYNDLSSQYNTHINEYNELKEKYETIETNYNDLSSQYSELKEEYNTHIDEYDDLLTAFTYLKNNYDNHLTDFNKFVSNYNVDSKLLIRKSKLDGNGAAYLWSGTLENFNALTEKPTDTTFIITN